MKIIVPKTYIPIDPKGDPLFFFGGPVGGGGDWQRRGCSIVAEHLPDFYAAIPYYGDEDYPLIGQRMAGDESFFKYQLDWEWHYIFLAAEIGCFILWLGKESTERPRKGGVYARDSRGEAARMSVYKKYNPHLRIAIGADPEFDGLSVIQRNFNKDQGRECPFFTTLEETIDVAMKLATQ